MADLDAAALAAVASRHLGSETRIENLSRLSGGASRETWAFDALLDTGARLPLILRRDPPGGPSGTDRSVEYALLDAAAAGGVPVPPVRFLLAPQDGFGTGFVMDRIPGETIARKILRDDLYAAARPVMARQCGEILARIHALDVAHLFPPESPEHPARAQIDQYRSLLDSTEEPHPAFEIGLRWLEARLPPVPRVTLVHGDFRLGNFIVGPGGICAVLDWELTHLGDPMEDLGWLCVKSWRFGANDLEVGGFGRREDLFAAYEASGGGRVDPGVVRYWEVFGNLKWGVLCMVQAFTHLQGLQRSVELAALGRRVCEMEHDLLELID